VHVIDTFLNNRVEHSPYCIECYKLYRGPVKALRCMCT
jgi:hypothetical protein